MKNPKAGCFGVVTGTWALMSNTVSGTFDSAAAVTKSLYSIFRNCGGYETGEERLKNPKNI
jgi:hypothetical protein